MPVDDDKTKTKAQAKDFYYILGVSPNASTEQVHEAYFELNEKMGPYSEAAQTDPETQQRTWRDIKTAYETLSEPTKRRDSDPRAQRSCGQNSATVFRDGARGQPERSGQRL